MKYDACFRLLTDLYGIKVNALLFLASMVFSKRKSGYATPSFEVSTVPMTLSRAFPQKFCAPCSLVSNLDDFPFLEHTTLPSPALLCGHFAHSPGGILGASSLPDLILVILQASAGESSPQGILPPAIAPQTRSGCLEISRGHSTISLSFTALTSPRLSTLQTSQEQTLFHPLLSSQDPAWHPAPSDLVLYEVVLNE